MENLTAAGRSNHRWSIGTHLFATSFSFNARSLQRFASKTRLFLWVNFHPQCSTLKARSLTNWWIVTFQGCNDTTKHGTFWSRSRRWDSADHLATMPELQKCTVSLRFIAPKNNWGLWCYHDVWLASTTLLNKNETGGSVLGNDYNDTVTWTY